MATSDEIDTKQLLLIAKKSWYIIVIVFLLGIGSTYYYLSITPPQFEATALVALVNPDQATQVFGGTSQRFDIDTQLAIIQSAAVLSSVQDQFRNYSFSVDVSAVQRANIVRITVLAYNPIVAKMAADAIAESYIEYIAASRQEAGLQVRQFIDEQLAMYQQEITDLTSQILREQARLMPSDLAIAQLQQEIEVKRNLINSMLLRREEVSIVARENTAQVRVIDPAQFPSQPAKPNIPLVIAVGVLLSAALAYGAAYGSEFLRGRILSKEDAERTSGYAIVGSIPTIRRMRDKAKRYLMQLHARDSSFSEHIRMLRTTVDVWLHERNGKMLLVTSSQTGEGKTTTAINLATACAHKGAAVLLIDANARNPLVEQLLPKKQHHHGLSQAIEDNLDLKKVIYASGITGLDVVHAGKRNEYPGEVFSSKQARKVLDSARQLGYDIIIVDAPSLDAAESSVLANGADGVLLVVRNSRTRRSKLQHATSSLSKAPVIGIVYNAT